MPVSLMSQWAPYFCRSIVLKFHLDKVPRFPIVKKDVLSVFLLQSVTRHYSTPSAFDYFFQLSLPALKYILFSVEWKCAL